MWKQAILWLCFVAVFAAGCSTMGEITGKAVKGVENAADDFKHGYRRGKSQ